MSEWIMPFAGRNHSSAVRLNFLHADGPVYVMDNHRAAMWCWMRHTDPEAPVGLLHVDRHYDALFSQKDFAHYDGVDVAAMDLEEYLNTGYDGEFFQTVPLFRWDNYLGLFMHFHAGMVNNWCFATHDRGQRPEGFSIHDFLPWHFPNRAFLQGRWVLNVDLDWFFQKLGPDHYQPMFSQGYVKSFFQGIRAALEADNGSILTLCLSPECCGGWENAEYMAGLACETLGIDFRLPEK